MQQLFSTTGAELSTIRAQVPPVLGAPHSRGVCPPPSRGFSEGYDEHRGVLLTTGQCHPESDAVQFDASQPTGAQTERGRSSDASYSLQQLHA